MKSASGAVGVVKDGFSCCALRHNSSASRVYWLGFLRVLGLDWPDTVVACVTVKRRVVFFGFAHWSHKRESKKE